MTESEIWAALAAGGLPRDHAAAGDPRLPKYNGLLDPRGAEALGTALAEQLKRGSASVVLVWEDVEDLILGFVVGRQLGVPVLRTFNADGLVGHSGPLPPGSRGLLVTDALRGPGAPRAIQALLESVEGTLVGTVALVDADVTDQPLLASLVAAPRREG